ncbi:hypothetical protein VDG09_07285 [Xanthomonas campestris pv. raphani]|uniref:hypothetical protein n=1 Tax=Xanthomonas campestris TaxID=339 RepID=UPI0023E9B308|nr:hypothetical protein [Xanthomonas campestris]MCW2038237.1 hypothetical protein [Xanthomonas campestris]MEA9827453.1 hypothetical protein [Xanthomonas campestris pv. raphani]
MGILDLFRKKPRMPASLEEGMASQANDFINAFRGPGSPVDAAQLDFSRDSIALVDRVLQDFHSQEAPLPEDLHFLASAYVFESARKRYGGRYLRGDQNNPFVLVIGEPDFQIGVCAMDKVRGRVTNGPEDNLQFFFDGIEAPYREKKNVTLV